MRSDRLRLLDMIDAIEVVAQYLPADRATFDRDPPLQSHIYRHLMIIGEAAWNLSPPIKDRSPQILWKQIEGMRRILAQLLCKVDWDVVYNTGRDDAPALKPQIKAILASLPPGPTAP